MARNRRFIAPDDQTMFALRRDLSGGQNTRQFESVIGENQAVLLENILLETAGARTLRDGQTRIDSNYPSTSESGYGLFGFDPGGITTESSYTPGQFELMAMQDGVLSGWLTTGSFIERLSGFTTSLQTTMLKAGMLGEDDILVISNGTDNVKVMNQNHSFIDLGDDDYSCPKTTALTYYGNRIWALSNNKLYFGDAFSANLKPLSAKITGDRVTFKCYAYITGDKDTFTGLADNKIKVTIDDNVYDNIDISSATSIADVVDLINTAVGSNVASENSDGYLLIESPTGVGITYGSENILNADFEDWSSGTSNALPDDWNAGVTTTGISRESTIVKTGSYSTKIVRSGTDMNIYQDISLTKGIAYWKGRTVTFTCWVWCDTADSACLSIQDYGTGVYQSTFHPGDSQWHQLTLTGLITSTADRVYCLCYVNTNDVTAYFDDASCKEVIPISGLGSRARIADGTNLDSSNNLTSNTCVGRLFSNFADRTSVGSATTRAIVVNDITTFNGLIMNQPTSSSTIGVISSSDDDTAVTVKITGVSGGSTVTDTVTANGTTEAYSSHSFTSVTSITKATSVGYITLRSNSNTVLQAVLSPSFNSSGNVIKVTIDNDDYDKIDVTSAKSISDIITLINNAVGFTVASSTSSGHLMIASQTYGSSSKVEVSDGTDTMSSVVGRLFKIFANRTDAGKAAYKILVNLDGNDYDNIDLSTATSMAEIATLINSSVGEDIATTGVINRQPSIESKLQVVSSDDDDRTQSITVTGIVNGSSTSETIYLAGADEALSVNSYTSITSITKSAVTKGIVYVYSNNYAVTIAILDETYVTGSYLQLESNKLATEGSVTIKDGTETGQTVVHRIFSNNVQLTSNGYAPFDRVTGYYKLPVGMERALIGTRDQGIIILGSDQIWQLSPSATPSATDIPQKVLDMGCVCGNTAVQVGDDIYFLSADGVRGLFRTQMDKLQTGQSFPLSWNLQDEFNEINWGSIANSCAIYFDNKYIISLTTGTSTYNNKCWVYYPAMKAWVIYTGWNIARFAKLKVGGEERLYGIDSVNGQVYRLLSGSNDNGSAIIFDEITRAEDYGKPMLYKKGGEYKLKVSGGNGTLVVLANADDSGWVQLGTIDLSLTGVTFPTTFPVNFTDTEETNGSFHLDDQGIIKFKRVKFEHYCDTLGAEITILESMSTAFIEEYISEG